MFFKKKEKDESVAASKNWYEDRYQSVVVQRNFLIILIMISSFGIIMATLGVVEVTSSKKIEPFVIEIEEKTGIINVIRPFLLEKITQEEAITRYFLYKYVHSRETYNPSTFKHDYYHTVRLLSTGSVYNDFYKDINSTDETSSVQSTLVSRGSQRIIDVLSINDRSYMVRAKDPNLMSYWVTFKATTKKGKKSAARVFTAIVDFKYMDIKKNLVELSENPLGFQVFGYTVNSATFVENPEDEYTEGEEN